MPKSLSIAAKPKPACLGIIRVEAFLFLGHGGFAAYMLRRLVPTAPQLWAGKSRKNMRIEKVRQPIDFVSERCYDFV
jgi:hypothetical protein